MKDLVLVLAVVGALVACLAAFAWLARRVRRSGVGAAIAGPIDEIYRPTAHHVRADIRAQEERMVPLPPADDRLPSLEPAS